MEILRILFLSQLSAVLGVGLTIWAQSQNNQRQNEGVETTQPARSVVEAATSTLQYGGVEALEHLLDRWQSRPMPQVYAVDEQSREIKHRTVTKLMLDSANEVADSNDGHYFSQRVKLADGRQYLLFVPDFGYPRPPEPAPGQALGYGVGDGPPPPPASEGMNPGGVFKPIMPPIFPFKPLLAGVLVSFIFAALLAWYFAKPIKQLRQAFASAASGNLNVRVGESMGSRHDELADLGNAFDLMASRLGALLQSQTRLLHQVSHELRSPLARLQIAVGLARQQPEKLASSLTRIERESECMDDLVGGLLTLSRLESGAMKVEKEAVDLNELLSIIVEDARFEGDSKKITIDYSQQDEKAAGLVTLSAQQDLLHRAIDNVVRNALKYSPEQSHVVISTSTDNAYVTITVSDQGGGVAEDELEMIFQPFFRGTNGNQADGHGVGLAIAKQIVEAHDGTIVANNQATGGLSVTIKLSK